MNRRSFMKTLVVPTLTVGLLTGCTNNDSGTPAKPKEVRTMIADKGETYVMDRKTVV